MGKMKTRAVGPWPKKACRCELTRASLRPGGAGVTVPSHLTKGSQAQKATGTPACLSLSAVPSLVLGRHRSPQAEGPHPCPSELYFLSPPGQDRIAGLELVCTAPWSRVSNGQGRHKEQVCFLGWGMCALSTKAPCEGAASPGWCPGRQPLLAAPTLRHGRKGDFQRPSRGP